MAKLTNQVKILKTEKKLLEAERMRIEQELNSLRNEIERLREPPLIAAVVIKVLDEEKGRALVMSSTGPAYAVIMGRNVKKKNLVVGQTVLLNQRTFAIMEIVEVPDENWEKANLRLYRGVRNQISELLINNIKAIDEQIKTNKNLGELIKELLKIK